MIKKSFTTFLLCTIFTQITNAQVTKSSFQGCYAGISIGYSQTNIRISNTFENNSSPDALALINGLNHQANLSGSGMPWGLFAGYGYQFGSIYLGAEIEAAIQNIKSFNRTVIPKKEADDFEVATLSTHNTEVRSRYHYYLAIKAGYEIKPEILAYGKTGYGLSRFRLTSHYPFEGIDSPESPATYKTSRHKTGFLVGFGLETVIKNSFGVAAEVTYHQSKKTVYTHPYMSRGTYTPSAFTFAVKVSYKFGS